MEVETTQEDSNAPENKPRLGNCEVCAVQPAKYTCPKCEVKTCCLNCQKIHKKELECDGIRDRTKYIPFNKFTDMDMSSDYRFLEECGRAVDQYKKESRQTHDYLPKHLFNLKKAAESRNITYKLLPQVFERRKRNTTRFDFRTKTIYWLVEWVFPSAQDLTLRDERVPETEKLKTIASKYFDKQEDGVLQERLQYYQSVGVSKVNFFLKAEGSPDKFHLLDGDESLRNNLKKRTVIEYPVIHVMFEHQLDQMDIVDSDGEGDEKDSNNHGLVNQIIKKAQAEESTVKPTTNFLFCSDDDN